MKIYLDDIRDPYDDTWTLARSYDEFVILVLSGKNITHLSLDHDLGMIDDTTVAQSGMDAAKFFVEYSMDNPKVGSMLEKVIVHSSNPPGVENIKGYFKSAKDHGIVNAGLVIIR